MTVSPSAPADSAARAFSTTPSLVSFARMGLPGTAARQVATTSSTDAGPAQKARPPHSTFGHERLSSTAETRSSPARFSQRRANSLTVSPATETKMGIPRSNASRSCKKLSTPGFWRPIELTIPAGVSATRGGGLPALADGVVVLGSIAP
jgi:hypothetical protein